MSELQLIVEHLNKEPFRLGLTLVAFDEKSNFELLQILHEVFVEIDPTRHSAWICVRRRTRSTGHLHTAALGAQESTRTPKASVSRPLPGSLNVPQEYFGDGSLNAMYEHYQQLQNQFKTVHKEVDQLRASKSRPGATARDRTAGRRVSSTHGEDRQSEKEDDVRPRIPGATSSTSALRKEQEEQAKLAERKRDQLLSLSLAEKRARELKRDCKTPSSLSQDATPEQLFERLQSQVARNNDILTTKFQQSFELNKRLCSDLNVYSYQAQIADAQVAQGNGEEDKLAVFRQHANLQARKLAEKEDELEQLRADKQRLVRSTEELETNWHQSRQQTNQYKKVKAELAELTAESVDSIARNSYSRARTQIWKVSSVTWNVRKESADSLPRKIKSTISRCKTHE
ncbi:Intraflagellar transport protein 81 [Phytophthora cactorum]|nr:Intraflagellar transport protein 81 [Phytophthora cactorum]